MSGKDDLREMADETIVKMKKMEGDMEKRATETVEMA